MHKMKNISIDYLFTTTSDCGLNVPASTGVGGIGGAEVYDTLKPTNYIVVGGMGLPIWATGGYVQGGGHGVLNPFFGLAVNNV